jgi:polyhydroxyalkanoate synthase subunit PhaC
MNFDANWQKAATQMQEAFKGMVPQLQGTPQGSPPSVQFDAVKLQQIQQSYIDGATALWNQSLQAGSAIPPAPDRRFSAPAWNENPVSKFSAAAYLLNA